MRVFGHVSSMFGLATAFFLVGPVSVVLGQAPAPPAREATPVAMVDAVFSRWDSTLTPGCTVGVARSGEDALFRGYGMADLEHGAVIHADTIFEAGSVSKQFTAAAVLLLARDGKLSLDDPVRRHFPELPAYAEPVTIRHMLQHTSGLRDWGDIAGLSGWPRTTRAYTHGHVLDILTRQTALNFAPGTDWSYSNSGYNLAAMLVARASGEPFAEFTRKRLFEPLGMRHTSWRDDRTRIVMDRAIAYDERDGVFSTLMPFENVHGNGGLLTTVRDLLLWNRSLFAGRIVDAAFAQQQQRTGTLADNRDHGYAMGLFVGRYKGLREIYHGGATAGYRAFLTHFPEQDVSVAVLCNAGSAAAERYAHEVSDLYLADAVSTPAAAEPVALAPAVLDRLVGSYRSAKRGVALSIVREGEVLKVKSGPSLAALSPTRFRLGNAVAEVEPGADGRTTTVRVVAAGGGVETYERVEPVTPTPAQLREFEGTYRSDEAEATILVAVEDGRLVAKRRPDSTRPLEPLYADAFDAGVALFRFVRDGRGVITHLSVGTGRAWDVRFERVPVEPAQRDDAR